MSIANNMLERMSILKDCFTEEGQITLLQVGLFYVTLNFHSGMCVTISNHRKVIKLWDTPRRKVRGSSPCFYTSDSLGTVAPWLIACDQATHNKCHREGLPRAAKYSSLVCAVTWVSILSGNQGSPLSS